MASSNKQTYTTVTTSETRQTYTTTIGYSGVSNVTKTSYYTTTNNYPWHENFVPEITGIKSSTEYVNSTVTSYLSVVTTVTSGISGTKESYTGSRSLNQQYYEGTYKTGTTSKYLASETDYWFKGIDASTYRSPISYSCQYKYTTIETCDSANANKLFFKWVGTAWKSNGGTFFPLWMNSNNISIMNINSSSTLLVAREPSYYDNLAVSLGIYSNSSTVSAIALYSSNSSQQYLGWSNFNLYRYSGGSTTSKIYTANKWYGSGVWTSISTSYTPFGAIISTSSNQIIITNKSTTANGSQYVTESTTLYSSSSTTNEKLSSTTIVTTTNLSYMSTSGEITYVEPDNLIIKNGINEKRYSCKTNHSAIPYLQINDYNYLDLTTNSTTGLYLKVKYNDVEYRPVQVYVTTLGNQTTIIQTTAYSGVTSRASTSSYSGVTNTTKASYYQTTELNSNLTNGFISYTTEQWELQGTSILYSGKSSRVSTSGYSGKTSSRRTTGSGYRSKSTTVVRTTGYSGYSRKTITTGYSGYSSYYTNAYVGKFQIYTVNINYYSIDEAIFTSTASTSGYCKLSKENSSLVHSRTVTSSSWAPCLHEDISEITNLPNRSFTLIWNETSTCRGTELSQNAEFLPCNYGHYNGWFTISVHGGKRDFAYDVNGNNLYVTSDGYMISRIAPNYIVKTAKGNTSTIAKTSSGTNGYFTTTGTTTSKKTKKTSTTLTNSNWYFITAKTSIQSGLTTSTINNNLLSTTALTKTATATSRYATTDYEPFYGDFTSTVSGTQLQSGYITSTTIGALYATTALTTSSSYYTTSKNAGAMSLTSTFTQMYTTLSTVITGIKKTTTTTTSYTISSTTNANLSNATALTRSSQYSTTSNISGKLSSTTALTKTTISSSQTTVTTEI